MGYNHAYFGHAVQRWIDIGWLAKGHRLIEFGAQEFFDDVEQVRNGVRGFLLKQGFDPVVAEGIIGTGLPRVRLIYEMLGIDYTAIDVDGAFGSTFFDLNTYTTPKDWMGTFDFINDEGTIEHLVNPINCFHVAHDMAKVGGVIRHSFPLIGWREHGFFYPTAKFCAYLVGDNGYELLQAEAESTSPTPFEDPFFKMMKGQETPAVTNLWARLTYRKVRDQTFVIPVDHVGGLSADDAKRRLREHYDRTAGNRL